MPYFAKSGGIFRQAVNIYAKQSGIWRQARFLYAKSGGVWRLGFQRSLEITIVSDQFDYTIYDAAIGAGWNGADPVDILLTINAGVFVRASSVGSVAINTGAFPVGSTVTIVNNGEIEGKEGAAGAGGVAFSSAPTNGQAAGHAINLQISVTIDNTSGVIFGGPGGGGGGDWASRSCGSGKSATSCSANGGNGATGASQSGVSGSALACCGGGNAGSGGSTGDWGVAGGSGTAGFGGGSGTVGAGGAAGKAVQLNGNTCNITGGSNPAQVRGAVS